ncbi:MFS transporter [Svornostia abyssi]|uniref:MFS transporter n=1 Tax=Svornostia abyssi TaxID=2898438 RepID=A0ABY5PGG9_9ACTN|nr:MFS transporter [Parviterribacteraceae bacterium J379]
MTAALRVPLFRRLLASYAGDECGDWFVAVAAAILVFEETGSTLATTALFLANRFLPAFAVPPLSTRLDRFRPTRALAGLYAIDAVVLVGLAALASRFSLTLVCILALADGTLAAVGRAVVRSTTATVMTEVDLLREGNAVLNVSFGLMNVAAPAAAGVLVAATSVRVVFLIGAGIFALLALLMLLTPGPVGNNEGGTWQSRLREGASAVLTDPRVRTILVFEGVLLVLFSVVTPIEIALAKESLGTGDAGYGLLLACWGGGMVAGGLAYTRMLHRSIVRLLVISSAMVGISYVAMGLSPTLAAACAAAVFGGVGNGMQWVTVVTLVQEAMSADMQTRVAGILEAVGTAMPGVGFLLGGVLASVFDPRVAFVASGLGVVLVVSVFLLVWPAVRRPPASSAA